MVTKPNNADSEKNEISKEKSSALESEGTTQRNDLKKRRFLSFEEIFKLITKNENLQFKTSNNASDSISFGLSKRVKQFRKENRWVPELSKSMFDL